MPQMSTQLELPFEDRGEAPNAGRSVEASTLLEKKEGSGASGLMERVVELGYPIEPTCVLRGSASDLDHVDSQMCSHGLGYVNYVRGLVAPGGRFGVDGPRQ